MSGYLHVAVHYRQIVIDDSALLWIEQGKAPFLEALGPLPVGTTLCLSPILEPTLEIAVRVGDVREVRRNQSDGQRGGMLLEGDLSALSPFLRGDADSVAADSGAASSDGDAETPRSIAATAVAAAAPALAQPTPEPVEKTPSKPKTRSARKRRKR